MFDVDISDATRAFVFGRLEVFELMVVEEEQAGMSGVICRDWLNPVSVRLDK